MTQNLLQTKGGEEKNYLEENEKDKNENDI